MGVGYVPVYTLHEMHVETGHIPKVPVILCSGCSHPIPAPNGDAEIQCRDCGRKMHIRSIRPAAQASRAQ